MISQPEKLVQPKKETTNTGKTVK